MKIYAAKLKRSLKVAKKKLTARVSDGAHKLSMELRIQRVELALSMLTVLPKEIVKAWYAFRWIQDRLTVISVRLSDLETITIGSLSQELGIRVCTPCDTSVEDQVARVQRRRTHLGPRPDGAYICHRCDVPKCVAADHLFWGSPLDNVRDRILKGRGRKAGEFVSREEAVAFHRDRLQKERIRLESTLEQKKAEYCRLVV